MQIYQEARSSSVYINGRNHWWAVRICVALVYCILTNSGTDNRYISETTNSLFYVVILLKNIVRVQTAQMPVIGYLAGRIYM